MHAQHQSLLFRGGSRDFRPPFSKPSQQHQLALFFPWKTSSSLFMCVANGNSRGGGRGRGRRGAPTLKLRGKDNVWSVDNALAGREGKKNADSHQRRRVKRFRKKGKNSRVMVSDSMLVEVETVLQTQEPVIRPLWDTFLSSVSGIWKGVGAVFSPITACMEPVGIDNKNENLYDCYTLSSLEKVPSSDGTNHLQRKIKWATLNPDGEMHQKKEASSTNLNGSLHERGGYDSINKNQRIPSFESFDLTNGEVMEEDLMPMEPGLVFFEDGSYSRGPVEIPVGAADDSTYFLSPTFRFEQCLVKGCHKRLRIVHTIEFKDGGSDIQIIRVALYEEQWVCPTNVQDESDVEFDLKPFSQCKRIQPSDLAGSWKVFETSATVIYEESTSEAKSAAEVGRPPYVYLCMETLKKRSLPENPIYFGEEELLDMEEVTVLWLPGGVTGYVDVKDGILCIGVGWYSDEGINLVMERDYGVDGKLKEVRWKTELKRRWSDPAPL
ncbi:hypothetical protein EJ110_NYTH22733 [Nymphaea thermarum]|nr:hypothetical protein EJ110_NYTH22733 [Nymphaea thermarum]